MKRFLHFQNLFAMLHQGTKASTLSWLDVSALHIMYEATVWVPDFVLTECIVTLCPKS
jgi:hypothetical protein